MSFFPKTIELKKKIQKFGIIDIFREQTTEPKTPKTPIKTQQQKLNEFVSQLAQDNINYHNIQKLAWNGIPQCLRPKIWKYLLRYVFINSTDDILRKKRNEYQILINNYWKPQFYQQSQRKIYNTINGDVKRIGIEFNSIFKQQRIQFILKRLLFIWHIRHPASGYVQGMCDIVNPFLIVFLSEYLPLDTKQCKFNKPITTLCQQTLNYMQADIYWCTSKMLQYVTKNYINGFNGLHEANKQIQQLLQIIDQQLYKHFIKQKIDIFSLSFRCISTMLLRMFNPIVGIRLFDTYISYQDKYPNFIIYILIAILEKFAKKMLTLRSDQLMSYLQKLPTKDWGQGDLQIIIAQAFLLQKLYHENQKKI